ncbi:MAG: hypothetical protein M3516_08075 [Actinomycetota bacterium]|nr:hypothetical protein [Actinomycetota bacterium]
MDGAPRSIQEGTRLRGDHPAVQAFPAMFCGPNPDDAAIAEAKRAAYAQAFESGNQSRAAEAEPSMVAKSIPDEYRLVVTRDHISPGERGSGYGVILHAGETVDARSAAVKELSKIDKTLFEKPQ